MTYCFVQPETGTRWGRLSYHNDASKDRIKKFASYLLGTTDPASFWVIEEETKKAMPLLAFCNRNHITPDLIKR